MSLDLFVLSHKLQTTGGKEAEAALARVDKAGLSAAGSLGKLSGAFKLFGTVAAAVGIGTLLKRMIDEAGNAEVAMASYQQAVENTGVKFEGFKVAAETAAASLQHLTRFEDDEAIAALAKMTAITGDSAKALRNLGLAADIAAFKHVSLESAAEIVGRVLTGNTRILREFGINVKDGGDVMQQLRDKFGGFAEKEGATFQGRLAQIRNEFNNVLEALGRVITDSDSASDMMGKLRDKLSELSKYIDENAEKWKAWGKDALQSITTWYDGFTERADKVAHWFNVIAQGANTAGAAFRAFLLQSDPAAWKNLIAQQKELNRVMSEGMFTDVSGGGSSGAVGHALPAVVVHAKQILDSVTGALNKAADRLSRLSALQGPHIQTTPQGFTPSILAGDMPNVPGSIVRPPDFDVPMSKEAIIEGIRTKFEEAREAYGVESAKALDRYWENIRERMNNMGVTIREGIAQTLGDAIYNGFAAAFNGEGLGGIFKAFGKTILAGVGSILTDLGKTWLEYGILMTTLGQALWNPFTSGPAAIAIGAALIALGGALGAVAHGGGGRGTAQAGAFRENPGRGTEELTRFKFIDRNGTQAVTPLPPMHFTIIGENDPVAQRTISNIVIKAARRAA